MPIIALSANVMEDVMDKCVSAGFDSYVTKPVDFVDLSGAMTELLDPEGKHKAEGKIVDKVEEKTPMGGGKSEKEGKDSPAPKEVKVEKGKEREKIESK